MHDSSVIRFGLLHPDLPGLFWYAIRLPQAKIADEGDKGIHEILVRFCAWLEKGQGIAFAGTSLRIM
jgi:hypothetical protein